MLPDTPDETTVIETDGATIAMTDTGIAFFDPDTSQSWLTARDPINLRDRA